MYGCRVREKQRSRQRLKKNPLNIREQVKKVFAQWSQENPVADLEKKIQELTTQLDTQKATAPLRQQKHWQAQLHKYQQQLLDVQQQGPQTCFQERIQPLLKKQRLNTESLFEWEDNDLQQQEAFIMQLCHPQQAVPVYIQTHRCTRCRRDLVVKNEQATRVCPSCGFSVAFIPVGDDHYYDFQHAGHQVTPVPTQIVTKTVAFQDTDATPVEDTEGDIEPEKDIYVKPETYRQFLHQFEEGTPEIPTEVVRVLCTELQKVHLMLAYKVKYTPVVQILREAGFHSYVAQAWRLTKVLKSEPVPLLSSALVDRLVSHFPPDAVSIREHKKIQAFSRITADLLASWGETELADQFQL